VRVPQTVELPPPGIHSHHLVSTFQRNHLHDCSSIFWSATSCSPVPLRMSGFVAPPLVAHRYLPSRAHSRPCIPPASQRFLVSHPFALSSEASHRHLHFERRAPLQHRSYGVAPPRSAALLRTPDLQSSRSPSIETLSDLGQTLPRCCGNAGEKACRSFQRRAFWISARLYRGRRFGVLLHPGGIQGLE